MKNLLLFAFVLCTVKTQATNYYFSNLTGDDSRTAAVAQNPSTAWKTLIKLNSVFSTFKGGDSILLKRGECFYGYITINKSGTSKAPLVIGAYGKGEDPIVTGLVSLTWIAQGNDLWSSNQALLLPALNLVTADGVPAGMGRWPNLDNGNGGYDSIRSSNSKSITDKPGLIISPSEGKPSYFVGAEIVVRTKRWALDRHPITAYSSKKGTITFDPSSTNEVHSANFGYFIQDDSTALDRQNEWWYNRESNKLKIFSNSLPYHISAANVENLLSSLNFSFVTIDNVTFDGCNADAISIEDGSHIVVQNCTIKNAGRNAVKVTAPYCSFLNNTIVDIMSKGILVNPEAHHTIIRYNTVRNISQIAGAGTSQREDNRSTFSGDGVYIKGKATIVEYNTFIKMGYSAVHVTKVDSIIIRYNFIDTVCNVFDDGGAIYAYTGTANVNNGREISNNIILHGIGAFFGSGVRIGSAPGAGVAGIYNDRGTSGAEEHFNTVAYFEKGLFMNYGCNRISVTNNTFYHNGSGLQINTRLKDKTRNLKINNNIAVAAIKEQRTINTYSDDGDVLDLFGVIDNNFYSRPVDDKLTISWQTDQGSDNIHNASLADWQSKFPMYDAKSKKGMQAITTISQIRFEYNASMTPKTIPLNSPYIDAEGNIYATNVTLQPFRSVILIRTIPYTGPPSVSLINPPVAEKFTTLSSVNTSAKAANYNSLIPKKKKPRVTTLLKNKYTTRHTFNWKNAPAGEFPFTNGGTGNESLLTLCSPLKVSPVTIGLPPSVSITSPSLKSFTSQASIIVEADATDIDGSISKVEFFDGPFLINVEYNYPYSWVWENASAGKHTICAVATDNTGLTSRSKNAVITVTRNTGASLNTVKRSASTNTDAIIPGNNIAEVSVGPNPASSWLSIFAGNLEKSGKFKIAILSASGQLIKNIVVTSSAPVTRVDISSLASGSYILRFKANELIFYKPFQKL